MTILSDDMYLLNSSALFFNIAGNHFFPSCTSTFARGGIVVYLLRVSVSRMRMRMKGCKFASVADIFLLLFTVTTLSLAVASDEMITGL